MNILVVGNFLSATTGTRSVCEDLAIRLATPERRVLTASPRPQRVARLGDMLHTAWHQRHHYEVAQVDVYSGLAFVWAEAVCWVLRRAKRPYVLTLHGGSLPEFAQRWPWRVCRLLGSAAAVTTPSRFLLGAMQPYRSDLRLLPNPIDLSAYPFRLRTQPTPRLVWLRAFHSIYQPTLAPAVVARLHAAVPQVALTMIGPDTGDGSLQATRAAVLAQGVQARVTLQPQVPKAQVPHWLAQGDIFLNTTTIDNTPVSVLEAMACGLCVVSTNVGGIPYLLDHGVDALLVPAGDAEAMAAAISQLLTTPLLAARLSRNARHKALDYDWAVVLPQWEALLQTCSERGVR